MRALGVALVILTGCSALFDGSEHVGRDGGARDVGNVDVPEDGSGGDGVNRDVDCDCSVPGDCLPEECPSCDPLTCDGVCVDDICEECFPICGDGVVCGGPPGEEFPFPGVAELAQFPPLLISTEPVLDFDFVFSYEDSDALVQLARIGSLESLELAQVDLLGAGSPDFNSVEGTQITQVELFANERGTYLAAISGAGRTAEAFKVEIGGAVTPLDDVVFSPATFVGLQPNGANEPNVVVVLQSDPTTTLQAGGTSFPFERLDYTRFWGKGPFPALFSPMSSGIHAVEFAGLEPRNVSVVSDLVGDGSGRRQILFEILNDRLIATTLSGGEERTSEISAMGTGLAATQAGDIALAFFVDRPNVHLVGYIRDSESFMGPVSLPIEVPDGSIDQMIARTRQFSDGFDVGVALSTSASVTLHSFRVCTEP